MTVSKKTAGLIAGTLAAGLATSDFAQAAQSGWLEGPAQANRFVSTKINGKSSLTSIECAATGRSGTDARVITKVRFGFKENTGGSVVNWTVSKKPISGAFSQDSFKANGITIYCGLMR